MLNVALGGSLYQDLRHQHVTDVEQYCDLILERSGVLLLPGTVFDESSRAVRVGFGRRSFREALGHYAAWARQA